MQTQNYSQTVERWDEAADVVIIGSGLAGLAAATEAAKRADRVVILEKMPYYGGNSVLAGGGYSCWDSRLKLRQKLDLGEDSWQLHMEDTLRGGGNYNIPQLVQAMAQGAPGGMDWLLAAGVPFKEVLARVGCHSAHRVYQCAASGKVMMDCVKRRALGAGAEMWLNTEVTDIVREAGGEVLGVECIRDGVRTWIHADRAVIIASGGFSRDARLRAEHNPSLPESLPCSNHKGATGEMIRYAKSIGADSLHMAFIQLYPCAGPSSGAVDRCAFYAYSGPGFGMIYVNSAGKRFISELAGRDEVASVQLQTCQSPTWAVFNADIASALGMTEKEIENGLRQGRLVKADSVPALEERLEMPKDGLTDTVERLNRALRDNEADPDFGCERAGMCPLEKAPFYAIAQWPSVHYTMGGLRIDEKANVIDVFGKPIPRLYAAGEVCGGTHGANRIGGNGLAECVVFGRVAGENASAEGKS